MRINDFQARRHRRGVAVCDADTAGTTAAQDKKSESRTFARLNDFTQTIKEGPWMPAPISTSQSTSLRSRFRRSNPISPS